MDPLQGQDLMIPRREKGQLVAKMTPWVGLSSISHSAFE